MLLGFLCILMAIGLGYVLFRDSLREAEIRRAIHYNPYEQPKYKKEKPIKLKDMEPYCPGTGCPIKAECPHFKQDIDRKKDIYLAWAPYDHEKESCEFVKSSILKKLKKLLHGEAEKDKGNS